MSQQSCGCVSQPCGCCEGVQQLTPASECNRAGLDAISYRVGTHGQFFATMKARLSTMVVDGVGSDGQTISSFRPLTGLTTRDASDPSIALLDGWATVGDVLSFYQERIANEGYLRTATERRSVLELSNLVGYTLRPGVASTVYLAYTIDEKQLKPVIIPVGARSQSIPGPGELPQSFETSDPLEARANWNLFKPRPSRPRTRGTIEDGAGNGAVYLKGAGTNLKINDVLLIDYGDNQTPTPYRVSEVTPEPESNRTLVAFTAGAAGGGTGSLGKAITPTAGGAATDQTVDGPDPAIDLIKKLSIPASIPPRNALTLTRDLKSTFTNQADIGAQMLTTFLPALQDTFPAALANNVATPGNPIRVYVLRAKAGLFGSSFPGQPRYAPDPNNAGMITISGYTEPTIESTFGDLVVSGEPLAVVALDGEYEKIKATSWVAIDRPPLDPVVIFLAGPKTLTTSGRTITLHSVTDAITTTRSASGVATKSTQLTIDPAWLGELDSSQLANAVTSTNMLRHTSIFAQSEELALADAPIMDEICDGSSAWIELDSYYNDLKSGRWVIVSGDRADVTTSDPGDPTKRTTVPRIHGAELLMLANVVQDVALPDGTPSTQFQRVGDQLRPEPLPGEKLHTFIKFAKDLQYCYSRDKVTIYGNVVKATHGETRNEVLGNGDGAKVLQAFTLKQQPLTFVAAPTAVGADSTLHAYINDVEWHETESLAWLGSKDRGFVTSTDDAGNTALTVGDGIHGARLPTGQLNVKAIYRNGIGRVGDVGAEQISLLQTRPLGVKAVINPMRASGGADKESRDLARENAPLSVMPLDRLVSVQDYADFTRRFAGIAKALAQRTSDNHRQLVYLTIAGVDDIPIDTSSDLYRNLLDALRLLGDPDLPLRVDARELKMLVLSAKIKILPDYLWEPVVIAVRAQLLDAFGFGKRSLGQWALLSQVISVIQGVRGVSYVDVDAFGAVPEKVPDGGSGRRSITPAEIIGAVQMIIDPDSVLKILHTPAAKDHLPKSVYTWPGGSDGGILRPAELAVFMPDIPGALVLNQIP